MAIATSLNIQGDLVIVANVKNFTVKSNQLLVAYNDGSQHAYNYADPITAQSALASLLAQSSTSAPVISNVYPPFVQASAGGEFTINGFNFDPTGAIVFLDSAGDTLNGAFCLITYVNPTQFAMVLTPAHAFSVANYDAIYSDANGASCRLPAAFSVTN